MVVIKRYPNRKLYNTETKRYITLDGIAGLIRDGDEVQIIDHVSDEDLTTLTLTQIIFEQEKKRGGFLPQAVLRDLIQAGGERLESITRTPRELFHSVEEEIDRRLQELMNRGELAREEGGRLRQQMLGGRWRGADSAERPVTTADLDRLNAQVDALLSQVDSLLTDDVPNAV